MRQTGGEEINGRHIATNPHDPHCIQSRQCFKDPPEDNNIQNVCNPDAAADPAYLNITNGNEGRAGLGALSHNAEPATS